jgi:hypothetical protein
MRTRLLLSLLAALALLASSAAHAGTLTGATWTGTTQGFPFTTTSLGATGTSTSMSVSVSYDYPDTIGMIFAYGQVPQAIFITQGARGTTPSTMMLANGTPSNRGQGSLGGEQMLTAAPAGTATVDMGVQGTVVVMTAKHAAGGVNQSTFMTGVNTLVAIPLSVGVADMTTTTFYPLGVAHTLVVYFGGWSAGTQVFAGLWSMYTAGTPMNVSPLPNVTAAGSWNLTSMGGGTVSLVSPTRINIDCALAGRRTASFTTLKLTFMPEPGTLLLLGAGALGLVLLGSRKR